MLTSINASSNRGRRAGPTPNFRPDFRHPKPRNQVQPNSRQPNTRQQNPRQLSPTMAFPPSKQYLATRRKSRSVDNLASIHVTNLHFHHQRSHPFSNSRAPSHEVLNIGNQQHQQHQHHPHHNLHYNMGKAVQSLIGDETTIKSNSASVNRGYQTGGAGLGAAGASNKINFYDKHHPHQNQYQMQGRGKLKNIHTTNNNLNQKQDENTSSNSPNHAKNHSLVKHSLSAGRQLPRTPVDSTWQQQPSHDGRAAFGTGIYLNSLQTSSKGVPSFYNNQLSPEHANAKKHENNSTNSHNATTSTTSSIGFSNLNRRMSRSLCAEDFAGLSMQNNNKLLPTIKNLEEAENYLSNSSINTNSTTLVKNMSDSGHETGTEHSQTSSVQPSKHHPQTSKLKKIGQTFKKMFTPVSCSSTNSSLVVQCTKPGAFDVVNGNNDKFKNDHHDLETSNSADDTKVLRMIPGLEGLNKVYLSDMHLTSLPPSFNTLKTIKTLALDSNKFKTIPQSVTQLPLLNTLYLNDNKIREFTSSLLNMSNLKYLWLQNNKITSLPGQVLILPSLQYLHVENNRIRNLPDNLGQAKQFRGIWLSQNFISKIPDDILCLVNLETLHIDRNPLVYMPDDLEGRMPKLKDFRIIHETKITQEALQDSIRKRVAKKTPQLTENSRKHDLETSLKHTLSTNNSIKSNR